LKEKHLILKGQSQFSGLVGVLFSDAISDAVLTQRRIEREVKDKWLGDSFFLGGGTGHRGLIQCIGSIKIV
jgi:hypothetical protein